MSEHTITAELKVTIEAYGIDPENFYPEVWTLHGRMIAMKAGHITRTVSQMKALGAVFQGRHPKRRYVLRRKPLL